MLRLILPLLFLAIQSALVIGRSQHICTQPIKKGPCMAYEKRYAFNTTSRQCQQFIYGGCQDNGNNFPSFDKCREVCQNECTLPKDTGSCKALFYHYYYNKATNKCEEFGYGGCEGNANNFKSKKECEAHCVITNPPE